MKWIKGKWDTNGREVFVNPQYITCVDLENRMLWAQDCDTAVLFEDEELPAVCKVCGQPIEEADSNWNKGEKKKNDKVS